ncbi:MAG: DUF1684 domain-containing protein [Acidobacteriota bacterium]
MKQHKASPSRLDLSLQAFFPRRSTAWLSRKGQPSKVPTRQILVLWMVATLGVMGIACGDGAPIAPEELAVVNLGEWKVEVEAWHQDRIQRLEDREGWLSLAGLFWLQEGEHSFGSGEEAALKFPAVAPELAGSLRLEAGEVTLIPPAEGSSGEEGEQAAALTIDGEVVTEPVTLASDAAEEATTVALGPLRFFVIDREGQLGVRLKNREREIFDVFDGIPRFPMDPQWRIVARWEAFEEPKTLEIPNVLGGVFEESSPGAAVFEIDGQEYRLEPTGSPDDELFFVFGDTTNGKSTYGGGRFLYAGPPQDGWIVLDFNRTYSPPCTFSPYATCPLARPEAKLPIAVEAGELLWDGYKTFAY